MSRLCLGTSTQNLKFIALTVLELSLLAFNANKFRGHVALATPLLENFKVSCWDFAREHERQKCIWSYYQILISQPTLLVIDFNIARHENQNLHMQMQYNLKISSSLRCFMSMPALNFLVSGFHTVRSGKPPVTYRWCSAIRRMIPDSTMLPMHFTKPCNNNHSDAGKFLCPLICSWHNGPNTDTGLINDHVISPANMLSPNRLCPGT